MRKGAGCLKLAKETRFDFCEFLVNQSGISKNPIKLGLFCFRGGGCAFLIYPAQARIIQRNVPRIYHMKKNSVSTGFKSSWTPLDAFLSPCAGYLSCTLKNCFVPSRTRDRENFSGFFLTASKIFSPRPRLNFSRARLRASVRERCLPRRRSPKAVRSFAEGSARDSAAQSYPIICDAGPQMTSARWYNTW